jgi:hypothetical protein
MPPKRIAQEVKFLKNFRKRFSNVTIYKAAVLDLFQEGLITETAYEEVLTSLSGNSETTAKVKCVVIIPPPSEMRWKSPV